MRINIDIEIQLDFQGNKKEKYLDAKIQYGIHLYCCITIYSGKQMKILSALETISTKLGIQKIK